MHTRMPLTHRLLSKLDVKMLSGLNDYMRIPAITCFCLPISFKNIVLLDLILVALTSPIYV
jgi:hypothetical protein